jgi:hypothetical protein
MPRCSRTTHRKIKASKFLDSDRFCDCTLLARPLADEGSAVTSRIGTNAVPPSGNGPKKTWESVTRLEEATTIMGE